MLTTSLLAMHLLSPEAGAEELRNIPSPWATVLPFGVPQFATHQKAKGFAFGGFQALGVGGAIYSGIEMVRLAEEGEVDQELRMRTVSAFSVGLAGAAWLVSVIDGSHARDVAIEKAQSARLWEQQRVPTLERTLLLHP